MTLLREFETLREPGFSSESIAVLEGYDRRVRPVQPKANATAQRFVRTVRAERLARRLVLNRSPPRAGHCDTCAPRCFNVELGGRATFLRTMPIAPLGVRAAEL